MRLVCGNGNMGRVCRLCYLLRGVRREGQSVNGPAFAPLPPMQWKRQEKRNSTVSDMLGYGVGVRIRTELDPARK